MMPAVHSGDVLTVGPIGPGSIAPGDIVLFRQSGRPIAHRVSAVHLNEMGETMIDARGDGKAASDAPVAETRVLGKVLSIDRRASNRGSSFGDLIAACRLSRLRLFIRLALQFS